MLFVSAIGPNSSSPAIILLLLFASRDSASASGENLHAIGRVSLSPTWTRKTASLPLSRSVYLDCLVVSILGFKAVTAPGPFRRRARLLASIFALGEHGKVAWIDFGYGGLPTHSCPNTGLVARVHLLLLVEKEYRELAWNLHRLVPVNKNQSFSSKPRLILLFR